MFLIAKNTIKEFWRNKLVRLIFFCGVLFLILAVFVSQLSIAENSKIMSDFSYFFLEIISVFFVLFFGSGLIANEKKRKTLNLILNKDHSGIKFIIGKYLGFSIVLMIFVVLLSMFFMLISLFFFEQNFLLNFLIISSIYLKLLVLLSIVLFFSSFVSGIVTIVSSLIIYLISHSIAFLKYYVSSTDFSGMTKNLINFVYYIFPNFQAIDFKEYLSNPLFMEKINFVYISTNFSIQILYILLVLFGTIIIFQKKHKKF